MGTSAGARTRASRRAGFSLIEVIVAMALLTVVMIILATMSVSVGRRGRLNDLTTKRNFALSQEAARIGAMRFTQLSSVSPGTTSMLVGDFAFNRRLAVSSSTDRFRIWVVIEPVAGEFRPDSVRVDRARPAAGTPLCTTC